MSNKLKILLALYALASASPVLAFDSSTGMGAGPADQSLAGSEEYYTPAYEVGSQTQQWLNMQREGSHASPQAQTLPGPVMDQVYQRYIKSFGHPIPDLYEERAIGQQ